MDIQRGIIEIDAPPSLDLDEAADFTLDLWRRERDPFVGAPYADAERLGLAITEVVQNRSREAGELVRAASGDRKIGDAKHAPDSLFDVVPPRPIAEFDFNPAHHRSHADDVEPFERALQIADEHLDEPRAVSSLERQLLVVDDDRVHACDAASAARWPLRTALSIVAGRPVAIQSPARNNPRTGVSVSGRVG